MPRYEFFEGPSTRDLELDSSALQGIAKQRGDEHRHPVVGE